MKKAMLIAALLIAVIATPFVINSLSVDVDAPTTPPVDTTYLPPSVEAVSLSFTETPTATVEPTKEIPTYSHNENIPLPFELQETMQQACEKYGVPYALALAVAESESSFDLEADSGTCWGVMQIHPINYPRLRENGIEPTEYEGNITAGVFLLGELLEKYTDTHKALMAYNCGETGAKRLWKEGYMTSKYSVKVVTLSEKWQEIINNDN